MFALRFSGRKRLRNLMRQHWVRKFFFVYIKFFIHKFLRDLLSFHFVFKTTISKMRNLTLGRSFIKTCSLIGF